MKKRAEILKPFNTSEDKLLLFRFIVITWVTYVGTYITSVTFIFKVIFLKKQIKWNKNVIWVGKYDSAPLKPVRETGHQQFPGLGFMRASLSQTYIHWASNLS